MSRLKSFRASYTESVVRDLFGTPSAARETAAKILACCREGKDFFEVGGKTYRRVSPHRPIVAPPLVSRKK